MKDRPTRLTIDTAIETGFDFAIQWGDGQQQTIHAEDLPSSDEVTHTFADGLSTPTIVVELVSQDGTRRTVGSLPVTVNDVPPTVNLAGAPDVDEGSPYTLTIGPLTDPGQDTVTQYIIDWGDGQQQTIGAGDLPASGEVTHTYADGPASPSIVVAVVDEDGTHAAAGSLAVAVNDVPPSVTLSGPDVVDEGAPYPLTIGTISDPGSDTVTQLVIDWGDGQQEDIEPADLPPDSTVTHVYASGPLVADIILTLVDEDGTHEARATQSVSVLNIPPTISAFTISANTPGRTDPNETVTATVQFTDPSKFDTHTAVIDWGDGSSPQSFDVPITNGTGSGSTTHVFLEGGQYHITLQLTDLGGNTVVADGFAYITGMRQTDDKLQIVGTDGNDILIVTPADTDSIFVNFTSPAGGNVRQYLCAGRGCGNRGLHRRG